MPFYTPDDGDEDDDYHPYEYVCTYAEEYSLLYDECDLQYFDYTYDYAVGHCDSCVGACIQNSGQTCEEALFCLVKCDAYGGECFYEEEITWLDEECKIPLPGVSGNVVDLSSALYQCRDCLGQCGWAFMEENDCQAAEDCVDILCDEAHPPADDDDLDDDDSDDDDSSDPDAPVLVDAYWEPAEFDMVEDCTDDTAAPCTALIWEVCDPNDDLSGGKIFVYVAGTNDPAFGSDIMWDDYLDGSPVDDCNNPYATGINIYFDGELHDWCPESGMSYYIGVDMEVSDGAENFSNMITDVEVVWNCE